MPIDPNHRALLRAVGKLTTQVGRIADTLADGTARDSFALAPPVVTDDDGAQTTSDDAAVYSDLHGTAKGEKELLRAELDRIYTRRAPDGEGYVSLTVDEQVVMGEELARIRRALDPDDETYIRETVDDQLAMTATLNRVRSALDDRPALCTDSVYERGWNDAAEMIRNALDGPPK
ncbi:hypothetical protein ACFWHG_05745 [Streptomyces microflavus]|uniref:hypothetical protein n=1 Tax=Streptomyces microflavus TaxID=1919 RepID=UPI00365667E6